MNAATRDKPVSVESYGHRGHRPIYAAKIGTGPSASIVVKRARKFYVGQPIEFADTWELRGQSVGCTPRWKPGRVWKIEDNRLFIDLH